MNVRPHERIRAAAIRVDGEHVVEAPAHFYAIEKAANLGLLTGYGVYSFDDVVEKLDLLDLESFGVEDGFVTTQGRFVDREEAAQIAISRGQASGSRPAGSWAGLDSAEVAYARESLWERLGRLRMALQLRGS